MPATAYSAATADFNAALQLTKSLHSGVRVPPAPAPGAQTVGDAICRPLRKVAAADPGPQFAGIGGLATADSFGKALAATQQALERPRVMIPALRVRR